MRETAENSRARYWQRFVSTGKVEVDADRNTVGNLLLQKAQCLLPYQLRHDLPHGLVGDGILVIKRRPIGYHRAAEKSPHAGDPGHQQGGYREEGGAIALYRHLSETDGVSGDCAGFRAERRQHGHLDLLHHEVPALWACVLYPVAGGLGLVAGNSDLLADQTVHQRGFSHVGATDQCHKT